MSDPTAPEYLCPMPCKRMVMADVPRDPSHYRPTDHVINRCKQRGIPTEQLGDLIRDGVTQLANDGHPNYRFIKEYHHHEEPIALVANVETGEVVTVFYYTEYSHPEIDA